MIADADLRGANLTGINRHDLIWRLLFRSTSVAVLLAIAPFTIGDLTQQRVGGWIKTLPLLSLVLAPGPRCF